MKSAILYDAIIVGGGMAGLSAALSLGRARRRVLVVDAGSPRNRQARLAYGYLTQDGAEPAKILEKGRQEAGKYDVVFLKDVVESVKGKSGSFSVQTARGKAVQGRRIILATGMADKLPDIPGFSALWGRGAFSCPYCDGWEYRDQPLAVLGEGDAGFHFALLLEQWSKNLTLCLNGGAAPNRWQRGVLKKKGIQIVAGPLSRVTRKGKAILLRVRGDADIAAAAIFHHPASQCDRMAATQLGCRLRPGSGQIYADKAGRTSIAGVFAAGDTATRQSHLVTAAASGAIAAFALNEDLTRDA